MECPFRVSNFQALFLQTDTLKIDANRLQGFLPSELGGLSLTTFHVHQNQLNGEIPEEFWSNTLLQSVWLDHNSFNGTLSGSIGNLGEVTELYLGNNTFTGTLPLLFGRLSTLGMF
jgi:hypothetical protein